VLLKESSMKRQPIILVLIAVAGVAIAVTLRTASQPVEAAPQSVSDETQPRKAPVQPQAVKADSAEAGIKKITAEYEKAFNAADAKAAAALWTEEGQYVGADGEVQKGRAAIQKSLAEFFKSNPKATAEVQIESVQAIGRGTATVEGVVHLKMPGEDAGIESRYTALHVLEDGVWRAASVQEWVPDPATNVSPKSMEWMIGDWIAKGDGGEVKITFAWDENKAFINGKYTITKDNKPVSSGSQMIGQNPGGGLRSWTFDSSGITNLGLWVKDGTRWISEVTALLPDGTEITSLNIVVPLGPNAFTWQTTDRAANGVPLPALPPVKVIRVKK
jgi:uncharacterized protein (TIGR02246 family)